MDKKVIFAVAGSGKTTYIINGLSADKRSLIITYTTANYYNILLITSQIISSVLYLFYPKRKR